MDDVYVFDLLEHKLIMLSEYKKFDYVYICVFILNYQFVYYYTIGYEHNYYKLPKYM